MSEKQTEDLSLILTQLMQNSPDTDQEINLALDKLTEETQETAEVLRQMQECQSLFVIQYEESLTRRKFLGQQAQLHGISSNLEAAAKSWQEMELLDQATREKVEELNRLRIKIIDQHQKSFVELSELQKRILDVELIRWKRGQQLAENGVPFENNLDQIQGWFESLADIIWQNLQQISEVEILRAQCHFDLRAEELSKVLIPLKSQINSLLSSLITKTFIVVKQPTQVIKTNTKFSATVRLLVGSKLGVVMTPPQVKVMIISEVQAKALLKHNFFEPGEASGDIQNNLATMQYDQATRHMSASFLNMKLRKIKRAEKEGTDSVPDEKFSLLFHSQIKVRDGELVFEVCAVSLPVVIVRGNQEPHAWATVTWDNAFAEPGRLPFQVPEKVPWKEMAQVLSTKFKVATGRELAPNDLQFIACKIFGSTPIHGRWLCLTWSQFCKEPLPGRNFTFWEWFYAIMETIREHLRNLWNDDLILGFVARQQIEDMLLKKCNGTFLLRFSDSVLGGVTLAWVTESQQREGPDIRMLQPFTSRDFVFKSMADRINDLNMLLFLYPDVPKDQAFGKYYTEYTETQPPPSNGCVNAVLMIKIPENGCASDSYNGTPYSILRTPNPGYHDT